MPDSITADQLAARKKAVELEMWTGPGIFTPHLSSESWDHIILCLREHEARQKLSTPKTEHRLSAKAKSISTHCELCNRPHGRHGEPGQVCGWCKKLVDVDTRHHPTEPCCDCSVETIRRNRCNCGPNPDVHEGDCPARRSCIIAALWTVISATPRQQCEAAILAVRGTK